MKRLFQLFGLKMSTKPGARSCHCPRAGYDVLTSRGIVHHDFGVTVHRGKCWLVGKTTVSDADPWR